MLNILPIFDCGRSIEHSVCDVALQTYAAKIPFKLMGERETGSRVPRLKDQGPNQHEQIGWPPEWLAG